MSLLERRLLSQGTLHEDFLLCAGGSVEEQGLGRVQLCYFLTSHFTSTCLRLFMHNMGSSGGDNAWHMVSAICVH